MPTYTYECYADKRGCGHIFEVKLPANEIADYKARCPNCKKKSSTGRNFTADLSNVHVGHASPQTLGALAERNTSKLSNDERAKINQENNAYRQPFSGALPEGASLFERDANGQRISGND